MKSASSFGWPVDQSVVHVLPFRVNFSGGPPSK